MRHGYLGRTSDISLSYTNIVLLVGGQRQKGKLWCVAVLGFKQFACSPIDSITNFATIEHRFRVFKRSSVTINSRHSRPRRNLPTGMQTYSRKSALFEKKKGSGKRRQMHCNRQRKI